MGKPRRYSEALFSEERAELDRKRKKMRLLQQRKMGDSSSYKDLPEDIPMQLTIGSRVTARSGVNNMECFNNIFTLLQAKNPSRWPVYWLCSSCGYQQQYLQDHL